MARVCEFCGYDFPSKVSVARDSWADGKLADFALAIGQVTSLLGAVGCVVFSIFMLFHFQFWPGALLLFSAVTQFALFVVFARVQQLNT